MTAKEIIAEFEKLAPGEQREVMAFLASKLIAKDAPDSEQTLGVKFSFEQASDRVFRENHELFVKLAKFENPSL